MILYNKNIRVVAYKCKKPMMKTSKRIKWTQGKISIDSKEIICHFDSNLGNTIHFEFNKDCYRITMNAEYYDGDKKLVCKYYINPLEGLELSTKKLLPADKIYFCH